MTPRPPGTGVFGFVEAAVQRVIDPYAELVAAQLGIKPGAVQRLPVAGPLGDALRELAPLREGSGTGDRHLLAPTAGGWTAYFENEIPGDARIAAAELPNRLGCRGLVVYAQPASPGDAASPLATVGFMLTAPGHAGMHDALRVLIVDADEPEPQTYGDPLPFEDTDPADLPLARDWLDRYCRALGVWPFDADFFFPEKAEGVLLTL